MFKTITILLCSLMLSQFAFSNEKSPITGPSAETLFNQLKGNYEYSYSAILSNLRIDTIVRHNDLITCEKEMTTYQNLEPIIQFTCELK